MIPDKLIKKQFKQTASQQPDTYYPTLVLKREGFERRHCKCGTFYWSVDPARTTCDDPQCAGGFRFIGNSPAKKKLTYIQVWQEFSKLFEKRGYTPIKRYPVAARWREDTDIVRASIYCFQPYVVSGEVEPPANPLVIPQFSMRFNDVDNVGRTGSHFTGFVMIGQHTFVPENVWDQNKLFEDLYVWFLEGMGIPKHELTIHEDAWAGGGNFGPSMEFFSRGLELANQVYMLFEQTPSGSKSLSLRVLDMGMGHERCAWFASGEVTSYEAVFPTVCKKLYHATGIRPNYDMLRKFVPFASYLNADEVDDLQKAWETVAQKINYDVNELRATILPLTALYALADHTRSLLVALTDGLLPSNAGSGYDLRGILRRSLSFADAYNWNIQLAQLCEWHAEYLSPLFPELMGQLPNVAKILAVEQQKYERTKQKTAQILGTLLHKNLTHKDLVELYDSHGITPELVRNELMKHGKQITVPDDFYIKLHEKHNEQPVQQQIEEKLDLSGVPETQALYYFDWKPQAFDAKVVKIIGKAVVLDKTWFYPTSGGQLHDVGALQNIPVVDVKKQGSHIVHVLAKVPPFNEGSVVHGEIDFERRKLLTLHHTATHILNGVTKKILGSHINQAGAKKTLEKAHLDITHYNALSQEELDQIENMANLVIRQKLEVTKEFLSRTEAEQQYGMSIYQGGAVPGKRIRIVRIEGLDVEACGGTHLNNTGELDRIRITASRKIQDGVVRIEYTSGAAAEKYDREMTKLGEDIKTVVGSNVEVTERSILRAAEMLLVEPKQLPATLRKFYDASLDLQRQLAVLEQKTVPLEIPPELAACAQYLFDQWKALGKQVDGLRQKKAAQQLEKLNERAVVLVGLDVKTMREVAQRFTQVLLINDEGSFVFKGTDQEFEKLCTLAHAKGGGKEMKLGKIDPQYVKQVIEKFSFY